MNLFAVYADAGECKSWNGLSVWLNVLGRTLPLAPPRSGTPLGIAQTNLYDTGWLRTWMSDALPPR